MRTASTSLFVAILLVAGCGNDVQDPAELERRVGAPIYWLGEEFEGFDLVHSEGSEHGALFVYGRCEPEGDTGCAPPLQLQNVKCPGKPTAVAIFVGRRGSRGLLLRAASALRPVDRRPARPPRVVHGTNPFARCFG